MCLGWFLRLGDEAYLLSGIPLVLIFQSFVRRRPLRELWVRNSDRFRLRAAGIVAALAFLVIPACAVVITLSKREWTQSAFLAAACAGAIGAGFSVQHVRLALSPRALWPFVAATLVGVGSMAIGAVWQARSPWLTASKLPDLFISFLTYIPVCFALEEVVFRGALDTHVWVPESSRAQAWISAFAVSSLWGLWHLPTVREQTPMSLLASAPILILFHAFDGALIAFSWRASGSLLLPAIYHSITDAYRDAIF